MQLIAVHHASAQAPTGNISGRVFSSDGQPLPGVTISVTSPNLQGARTAVSSETGDYLIALLPPGTYTVTFELDGFQAVNRMQALAGTQNASLDVTLAPAGVNVEVTVVGQAQPFVETAQVATNFKQDLMATLPSNRTIDAVSVDGACGSSDGPARRVHASTARSPTRTSTRSTARSSTRTCAAHR